MAIEGAKYIIAEWVSDNASIRKYIRNYTYNNGFLVSKKKKNSADEAKVYEMYYDFKEQVKHIKLYRVLAINRGEKEDILKVSIDIDSSNIILNLENRFVKDKSNLEIKEIVCDAINDSYKRLISPSIEREIRADLKEKAEEVAINNFSTNLEKLLMAVQMSQ